MSVLNSVNAMDNCGLELLRLAPKLSNNEKFMIFNT